MALKSDVQEFLEKVKSIDRDINSLKEDTKTQLKELQDEKKRIIKEYEDKLSDKETLEAVLKIIRIRDAVPAQGDLDQILDLADEAIIGTDDGVEILTP
jgi:predicted nuclease with TOPRIM domain